MNNKIKYLCIIILLILSIIISSYSTYFFINQMKQVEIDDLQNNYETEKNQYKINITNLNIQIDDLQNILNENNESNKKYVEMMIKGFNEYSNGENNLGFAGTNDFFANEYYEQYSFYDAFLYFLVSSIWYEEASNNYSSAMIFFDNAKENALNNKTYEIAEFYSKLCDASVKVYNEMAEAYEDFSDACWYFDENNYDTGNFYLELCNEHLKTYNSLIEILNDIEDELIVILENF